MIGFKIHYLWYEVGAASFLHSFFSTVAYRLEKNNWGSEYPVIMNELYQGSLKNAHVPEAIQELAEIKEQFKRLPPDNVVWDIEDLSAQPPWGEKISGEITDLSNYFVTSNGQDFIEVFNDALRSALEINGDLEITSFSNLLD